MYKKHINTLMRRIPISKMVGEFVGKTT